MRFAAQAKRRESKLGDLGASLLAGSKLKSALGRSSMIGAEDEDDLGADVRYNFRELATAENPEDLLKSMSFNVDCSKLYAIESTCINNQANPYCPVQIKVNDPTLVRDYGGTYLVQVWSAARKLMFQRVRSKPIECWNLIGRHFVFLEDQEAVKS